MLCCCYLFVCRMVIEFGHALDIVLASSGIISWRDKKEVFSPVELHDCKK